MALDKSKLLAVRTAETRDVEVPGFGTVTVRGLTRAEALRVQTADGMAVGDMEAYLVATALVDPEMSLDEVKQWQAVSPVGELQPVSEAVQELSGLAVNAVKDQIKDFRG